MKLFKCVCEQAYFLWSETSCCNAYGFWSQNRRDLSKITFSEEAELIPLQRLAVNLVKVRRKTEKCLNFT